MIKKRKKEVPPICRIHKDCRKVYMIDVVPKGCRVPTKRFFVKAVCPRSALDIMRLEAEGKSWFTEDDALKAKVPNFKNDIMEIW